MAGKIATEASLILLDKVCRPGWRIILRWAENSNESHSKPAFPILSERKLCAFLFLFPKYRKSDFCTNSLREWSNCSRESTAKGFALFCESDPPVITQLRNLEHASIECPVDQDVSAFLRFGYGMLWFTDQLP